MKILSSLLPIIDVYDAYIIDLWGVLHDGQTPYEGAINALHTLKAARKTIILLSNAPRRAAKAQTMLDDLGFARDNYDAIITSGEITFEWLTSMQHTAPFNTPSYYLFGEPHESMLLEGLPYRVVDNPKDAGFILNTGFDNDSDSLADKQPALDACLAFALPMICANPDTVVVSREGKPFNCAGILAAYYEAQGGKVHWFGKPYPAVYDACEAIFLQHYPALPKILAIGDSLHTDIAGAKAQNIASLLVAGGIHARDLGVIEVHPRLDPQHILDYCTQHGMIPDYVIPYFTV